MNIVDIPRYTLEEIRHLHHYNTWLIEKIKPHMGNRILEIGAGIGNLSDYFLNSSFLMVTDISKDYLQILKERYKGLKNVEVIEFSLTDIHAVEYLKNFEFDTVVCIDVLEHIFDDISALRNIKEITPLKGKLVLVVPALKFLYGSLDRNLGHYRRYSKKELNLKLTKSGFFIQDYFYSNFFTVFGWFLDSRILRKTVMPQWQLKLFDRLVPIIKLIEDELPIPFGQSLIAICKNGK